MSVLRQVTCQYILLGVKLKTDQFRDGANVVIAETGSATCPVQWLKRYFRMAGLQGDSQERLFRGIVHTKKGERLRGVWWVELH